MQSNDSIRDRLAGQIALIWGGWPTQGHLTLGIAKPGQKWKNFRLYSPEDISNEEINFDGANIYLSVGSHEKNREQKNMVLTPCIHLDIDFKTERKTDGLPESRYQEFLSRLPFTPTLEMDTGGGRQLYALFDRPRKSGMEMRQFLEWFVKKHVKPIADDMKFRLDPVYDLSRVFRVDGSMNLKYDPPAEVKWLHTEGPRLDFDSYWNQYENDDDDDQGIISGRVSTSSDNVYTPDGKHFARVGIEEASPTSDTHEYIRDFALRDSQFDLKFNNKPGTKGVGRNYSDIAYGLVHLMIDDGRLEYLDMCKVYCAYYMKHDRPIDPRDYATKIGRSVLNAILEHDQKKKISEAQTPTLMLFPDGFPILGQRERYKTPNEVRDVLPVLHPATGREIVRMETSDPKVWMTWNNFDSWISTHLPREYHEYIVEGGLNRADMMKFRRRINSSGKEETVITVREEMLLALQEFFETYKYSVEIDETTDGYQFKLGAFQKFCKNDMYMPYSTAQLLRNFKAGKITVKKVKLGNYRITKEELFREE